MNQNRVTLSAGQTTCNTLNPYLKVLPFTCPRLPMSSVILYNFSITLCSGKWVWYMNNRKCEPHVRHPFKGPLSHVSRLMRVPTTLRCFITPRHIFAMSFFSTKYDRRQVRMMRTRVRGWTRFDIGGIRVPEVVVGHRWHDEGITQV